MKFDTIRLIYLHPARTGGAQIEDILCENLGISKGPEEEPDLSLMFGAHSPRYGYLQHLTLAEMASLAAADLSTYSVLCSIRNPISRFVSAYFYNGCTTSCARPGELLARLSVQPMQHFQPQSLYTHPSGSAIYSYLIRQEHYERDLQQFCAIFGFRCNIHEKMNTIRNPAYIPYAQRNVIDLFHSFFSREERQLFYDLYREDFQLLYPEFVEIVENML